MDILLFRKLFSFSNDGFACHFVIYETFYDFLKRHQEEREKMVFSFFPRLKLHFWNSRELLLIWGHGSNSIAKKSGLENSTLGTTQSQEIKWKTGKMVQMFYYENHGKCCKTLWKHDGKKLKVSQIQIGYFEVAWLTYKSRNLETSNSWKTDQTSPNFLSLGLVYICSRRVRY